MEKEQFLVAKARAEEVVNGFKRATERNARDALKFAEYIELLWRELKEKDRQINEMKSAKVSSADNSMPEFLKGMFK